MGEGEGLSFRELWARHGKALEVGLPVLCVGVLLRWLAAGETKELSCQGGSVARGEARGLLGLVGGLPCDENLVWTFACLVDAVGAALLLALPGCGAGPAFPGSGKTPTAEAWLPAVLYWLHPSAILAQPDGVYTAVHDALLLLSLYWLASHHAWGGLLCTAALFAWCPQAAVLAPFLLDQLKPPRPVRLLGLGVYVVHAVVLPVLTHAGHHSVKLQPNITPTWYLFAVTFHRFREYFAWMFSVQTIPMVAPVLLFSKSSTPFASIATALGALCLADAQGKSMRSHVLFHALAIAQLPMVRQLGTVSSQALSVLASGFALPVIGISVMWVLWTMEGTGNANYFFFQALVLKCFELGLLFAVVALCRRRSRQEGETGATCEDTTGNGDYGKRE